jgi:hypothetical protein
MAFTVENPARNRTVELCARLCWRVVFSCENRHGGQILASELAERFPPETTLEAIAERLVCSRCGSRKGALDIRQDTAAAARRDVAAFEAKQRDKG